MKFEYRDGLLFTSIRISYKGITKTIDNIVIDTGASHTLLSQDEVDDIGIRVTADDEIVTSFGIGGKEHALIRVGDFIMKDVAIDFTSFPYDDINGLLGLDILMSAKFNIDLNSLELRLQ
ncbi:aspartyl protease family protein [Paenibacillus sp. UNC451MF]|uniref:aspartyl protease family protein n=1 Tax=Paenibacillus sp. UNC451MF TaxID=1449063 RepID=UPI00048AA9CC|nr:aspartyl protease family protein [Paenibacillus sp. UNC451MF]